MNEVPLITTRDLSRSFDDIRAVDHLNFDVYPGEIFGILGHNGAGKTTTIRLLNGLLKPSGGSARVLGVSPAEQGPILRSNTGVLTETPSLDERLTGRENLAIFADLFAVPVEKVELRIHQSLNTFGLMDRADDFVREYSKGMKQRLALARTLLHEPRLLFLDEPTAGLDPVSTRDVQDLIKTMSQQGRTIVLCTHNLEEAQKLCHRVAVLRQGKIIALGSPRDLARKIYRKSQVKIDVIREDQDAVLKFLRRKDYQAEVDENPELILIQEVDRAEIPDLIENLSAEKFSLYQVILAQPTLEDIYFTLHNFEENRS